MFRSRIINKILFTKISENIKKINDTHEFDKNPLVGAFMGLCGGICVNQIRISNTNYYVKKLDKDKIPEYPLHLRLSTGLFFGLIGSFFGFSIGSIGTGFIISTSSFCYYWIDHAEKYDKACEKIFYKESNTK